MSDDETTTELERFRDVMRRGVLVLVNSLPSLNIEQYAAVVTMVHLTSTDPVKARAMLEAVEANMAGDHRAHTALVMAELPEQFKGLEAKVKA